MKFSFIMSTDLATTQYIIHLLRELVHLNDKEKESGEVEDIVENRLLNQQVSKAETLDEAVDQVLSGLVAIIVEDAGFAFIIDVSVGAERRKNLIQKKSYAVQGTELLSTLSSTQPILDAGSEMSACATKCFISVNALKDNIRLCYLEDVADPYLVEVLKKRN